MATLKQSQLLALVLATCMGPVAGAPEEKLTPIFDGKTLEGWELRNGTAPYQVEDGVIVGATAAGSPNSFLCTKKSYGDFILVFEVKVDPELNSGVQIRSHTYEKEASVLTENQGRRRRSHPPGRVYGYQVEISNEKTGTSGGIYDEARRGWLHNISGDPAARAAFKDNQWNTYRVVAIGDSIKTWVNGVPCANVVDPLDLDGFIGLQVHAYKGDRPAQVRWRNIQIQDLGRHVWEPLFNGRSMDGWHKQGGGAWSVENGALRGVETPESGERGFLISDRRLKDFTVRLKYRAVKGNSGFFFRMGEPPWKDTGSLGYEVEIDPARDAGGLLEPGGRGWLVKPDTKEVAQFYRADDWNELVVSAHGGRVVVHVNGLKTAELGNDPGRPEGRLALQLNPRQDLEVMFKDIEMLRPEY